jgi:hypothetical protein
MLILAVLLIRILVVNGDGFAQHAGEDGGGVGVGMDGDAAPRLLAAAQLPFLKS